MNETFSEGLPNPKEDEVTKSQLTQLAVERLLRNPEGSFYILFQQYETAVNEVLANNSYEVNQKNWIFRELHGYFRTLLAGAMRSPSGAVTDWSEKFMRFHQSLTAPSAESLAQAEPYLSWVFHTSTTTFPYEKPEFRVRTSHTKFFSINHFFSGIDFHLSNGLIGQPDKLLKTFGRDIGSDDVDLDAGENWDIAAHGPMVEEYKRGVRQGIYEDRYSWWDYVEDVKAILTGDHCGTDLELSYQKAREVRNYTEDWVEGFQPYLIFIGKGGLEQFSRVPASEFSNGFANLFRLFLSRPDLPILLTVNPEETQIISIDNLIDTVLAGRVKNILQRKVMWRKIKDTDLIDNSEIWAIKAASTDEATRSQLLEYFQSKLEGLLAVAGHTMERTITFQEPPQPIEEKPLPIFSPPKPLLSTAYQQILDSLDFEDDDDES